MFLLAQLFQIAVITYSVMTADRLATFRAAPPGFFPFQELLHSISFDKFEVIDHAHMEKSPVALIEGFKPTAGKIFAFVAEPH